VPRRHKDPASALSKRPHQVDPPIEDPSRMNLEPHAPIPRFRESDAHRRTTSGLDRWAERAVAVVAWSLGLALLLLVGILVVDAVAAQSMTGPEPMPGTARRVPLAGAALKEAAIHAILGCLVLLPAGVLTGLYLAEYAPPGGRAPGMLRWAIRALAGVPGVVVGLFGVFAPGIGGESWLGRWAGEPPFGTAGIWVPMALALMALPPAVTATEQAFRGLPQSWRASGFALGATRLQGIVHLLLPGALPGIAGGVLVALGRIVGAVTPMLLLWAATLPPETGAVAALANRMLGPFVDGMAAADRRTLLAGLWFLAVGCGILNAAAAGLRERRGPSPVDQAWAPDRP
jgi:phosphate transport system permease protein